MIRILFLAAFFLGLILIYIYFSRSLKRSMRDATNSLEMQSCTSTNNSYPPMGDVLAELDEDLQGDMRGYMGDVCDES